MSKAIKVKYAMTSGRYNTKRRPIVFGHRQVVFSTSGANLSFQSDLVVVAQPSAASILSYAGDGAFSFTRVDCDNYTNGFSNFTYTYTPTVLTVVVRVASMSYDPHLSFALGNLQPIGYNTAGTTSYYWLHSVQDLVATGQAKLFSATDLGKDNVHLCMTQCFPANTMPYPSLQWDYRGDYNSEHICFALNCAAGSSQITVTVDAYLCMDASIVDCQIFDSKFWFENMSNEEYTRWARKYSGIIHIFKSDEAISSPRYPFVADITPAACIDYMSEPLMTRTSSQLNIKKHDNILARTVTPSMLKNTGPEVVPYHGGWFAGYS